MVEEAPLGRKLFVAVNSAVLILLSFACLFPIVHIAALSMSSQAAAGAGLVTLWPRDFTWMSYRYILENAAFFTSFGVTLERVALGGTLSLVMVLLAAYPLSKDVRKLRSRSVYAWFFMFTTIFGGGLIPSFMVVKSLGLMDSIWALVLPTAVPVFNILLMLNFFRQIPEELEEAAFMDGAGHLRTLWSVYLPVSTPSLATNGLLILILHWNSWFDGMIYMNDVDNYPLQTYIQSIIVSSDLTNLRPDELKEINAISDKTVKAAQIFVSMLPIMAIYPFLQKYFIGGMLLGSVKG
ncbi:carbohydrate ABC transporter permease [Paenibacillus pasadenensis]|uniref:carbohydrate ABC transporter permease n=1 Tax=Paenibacillus pasadenensis TaxID=217090 RepID=UPI00203DC83D|nr:carbohydrate ABC transporter permease [Paenibacillus pasadenensis]MCM3745735.1 carbohydrate ABC transporter permease [Paenibacillus pasadenensis]